MPSFPYRALTTKGEVVGGVLEAPSADLVIERVLGLGPIPIDDSGSAPPRVVAPVRRAKPRLEDVTIFSRDLALLLRTGTRINDALDLLSHDGELGRMRAIAADLHESVLAGQGFAEALRKRPDAFPPIFTALASPGEQTAMLPAILEAIAAERSRAAALRRRIVDALRYPAFLLVAASAVLLFFLTFVLPQFAAVFSDFHAKPDPVLATFLAPSAALRENGLLYAGGALVASIAIMLALRSAALRARLFELIAQAPLIGPAFTRHRTILFCRNLGLLLGGGVTLSAALRILDDVMSATGTERRWSRIVDSVRRGGKLSDALAAEAILPAMAVRTLRLGEESNQLPMLSARVADYYEARLDRSIDRIVAAMGASSSISANGLSP